MSISLWVPSEIITQARECSNEEPLQNEKKTKKYPDYAMRSKSASG